MLERPPFRVTAPRKSFRKFSRTCNATTNYDPDACCYCREPFQSGQMRYPIRNWDPDPWGVRRVSVCMPCFKAANVEAASTQARYERECCGCGEPILNPTYGVFGYEVCSSRCYQRDLRKSNRQKKAHSCKVCKRRFEPSRKDAQFCSNACRQW